jgi:hypothetical protein
MHPYITHELVKHKIAEDLRYAELQRRARQAAVDRPHWIDFSSIGQRLRVRLLGGTAMGGSPALGGRRANAGA